MHAGSVLQHELVDNHTLRLADSRDGHVDDLLGLEQPSKLVGRGRVPFPSTEPMNGSVERPSWQLLDVEPMRDHGRAAEAARAQRGDARTPIFN